MEIITAILAIYGLLWIMVSVYITLFGGRFLLQLQSFKKEHFETITDITVKKKRK